MYNRISIKLFLFILLVGFILGVISVDSIRGANAATSMDNDHRIERIADALEEQSKTLKEIVRVLKERE